MGIENNNAVLATTWDEKDVCLITRWIETLPEDMARLFAVVPAISNGKITVVMCPDGSKEGWDVSNRGDIVREQFIKQLTKGTYDDGSSSWEWIEVGYGEYGQKVLRGNNENLYSEHEYHARTVA